MNSCQKYTLGLGVVCLLIIVGAEIEHRLVVRKFTLISKEVRLDALEMASLRQQSSDQLIRLWGELLDDAEFFRLAGKRVQWTNTMASVRAVQKIVEERQRPEVR